MRNLDNWDRGLLMLAAFLLVGQIFNMIHGAEIKKEWEREYRERNARINPYSEKAIILNSHELGTGLKKKEVWIDQSSGTDFDDVLQIEPGSHSCIIGQNPDGTVRWRQVDDRPASAEEIEAACPAAEKNLGKES